MAQAEETGRERRRGPAYCSCDRARSSSRTDVLRPVGVQIRISGLLNNQVLTPQSEPVKFIPLNHTEGKLI